jgi:hypothetical protein
MDWCHPEFTSGIRHLHPAFQLSEDSTMALILHKRIVTGGVVSFTNHRKPFKRHEDLSPTLLWSTTRHTQIPPSRPTPTLDHNQFNYTRSTPYHREDGSTCWYQGLSGSIWGRRRQHSVRTSVRLLPGVHARFGTLHQSRYWRAIPCPRPHHAGVRLQGFSRSADLLLNRRRRKVLLVSHSSRAVRPQTPKHQAPHPFPRY